MSDGALCDRLAFWLRDRLAFSDGAWHIRRGNLDAWRCLADAQVLAAVREATRIAVADRGFDEIAWDGVDHAQRLQGALWLLQGAVYVETLDTPAASPTSNVVSFDSHRVRRVTAGAA